MHPWDGGHARYKGSMSCIVENWEHARYKVVKSKTMVSRNWLMYDLHVMQFTEKASQGDRGSHYYDSYWSIHNWNLCSICNFSFTLNWYTNLHIASWVVIYKTNFFKQLPITILWVEAMYAWVVPVVDGRKKISLPSR